MKNGRLAVSTSPWRRAEVVLFPPPNENENSHLEKHCSRFGGDEIILPELCLCRAHSLRETLLPKNARSFLQKKTCTIKKTVVYSSISMAVFLFILGTKEIVNVIGPYPDFFYPIITVVSAITIVLLIMDL